MAQYFYVDGAGTQCGPVDESALISCGVGPDTYVWCQGMPNWLHAKDVPDLAYLFAQTTNSGYPQNPPYPQNPQSPQNPYNPYGQGYQPQQPCPPTYLVWSIIITLCCCLVGGIVAIVYSTQVEPAWRSGDYALACKRSLQAKNWCIWSAIIGGVCSIGYTILMLCGALVSAF